MSQDFRHVEMPARYSQADAEWIQEQLLRLPPSLRRKGPVKRTLPLWRKRRGARPQGDKRKGGAGIQGL